MTVEATEPLAEADIVDFLRLAETLGPEALVPLAEARPAAPDWPADSTRTVAGLAAREDREVRRRLLGTSLANSLADSGSAPRFLDELGWSAERFASIGAALGLASVANDLTDERELRRLRAEADRRLEPLADDHRVFGALSEADAAAVRRRAAWIPRAILLDALLNCPPENRRSARAHAAPLAALLPDVFDRSALDRLLSDRERSAVPFHEPNPERDDARLRWDGSAVVWTTSGD